jgi:hypothetical protein
MAILPGIDPELTLIALSGLFWLGLLCCMAWLTGKPKSDRERSDYDDRFQHPRSSR